MYGREKSDPAVVAEKPTNNAGRPAAELVERRTGAEGNAGQQSTRWAQDRESVSQVSTPERICIGGRSKIASRSDVRRPRAEALVGSQHHQSQLSCSINEPAFPSRPGIPLPRRA